MLFKQGKQGIGGCGFLNEIERPQPHDPLIGLWLDIPGDHDHLVAQPFPFQGLQHTVTVHLRHGEIEKDEIAMAHQHLFDPFKAIGRIVQIDFPVSRERSCQLFAGEPGVITYQYIHGVRQALLARIAISVAR